MQIHDITDYYRPRRFPWLPVSLVGIAILIVGIYHFSTGGKQAIEADPDADLTEATDASRQPPTPAPGQSSRTSAPPPPTADREPAQPLSKAEIEAVLAASRKHEAEGRLEAARDLYLSILNRAGADLRPQIERAIGRLSIALFTTPRPMKGKIEYIIKPGDSLSSIAARHNCPVLLIQQANEISNPARIRAGQRLIFPDRPDFSILVSKTKNTLTLFLGGQFFKSYPVGTGRHALTPVGTFRITDKIKHPAWWPGDGRPMIPYGNPDNILGTHWFALEATGETPRVSGYGIHGTWDEGTIGTQSSAGCVRMRNADVEELFMLLPRGTPVRIVE